MKDMNVLIKTTKGYAKKELQKVVKKSESHIEDLNNHIKEGTLLLTQKLSLITKMEDEEKPAAVPVTPQKKQSLM